MTTKYIDADTHIVEDMEVWSMLAADELHLKPRVVTTEPDKAAPGVFPTGQYWMIDGELYGKGGQALINYVDGTRNFLDPAARVAQMDELGIAAQIIYPSIFLGLAPKSPATELALCRSYNRWMADVCARFPKRFYFVAVPSTKNIEDSVKDMEEWAAKGACGLLMRGFEDDKGLNHKSFWPLYAKAEALDLPICIHIGQGSRNLKNVEGQSGNAIGIVVPNLLAFGAIVNSSIPDEFKKLRFGIIESGSEWVPFAMSRASRYKDRYGVPDHTEDLLKNGRLFITCESHERLGDIIEFTGSDSLMLGTDYGHSDTSTELRAHELLEQRPDINADMARKITEDNPLRFYRM